MKEMHWKNVISKMSAILILVLMSKNRFIGLQGQEYQGPNITNMV